MGPLYGPHPLLLWLRNFIVWTMNNQITPEALDVLKANDFEHVQSDRDYDDYERPVSGFGEAGDDRIERVTFQTETGKWYPTTDHIDLDGQEWYHKSANTTTLQEAIDWLIEDQKTAPVKKTA